MDNLGECDIVLKGGMTSGVLYPALLAKLSTRFRFRGLGGSSAGAIAAALGAAAEYGRRHSNPHAFKQLGSISDELRNPERVSSLFEPDAQTRPLFEKINLVLSREEGFRPLRALKRFRTAVNFVTDDRAFEPWLRNGMGLCTGMAQGRSGIALVPWIHAHLNALAGIRSDDVLSFGMLRNHERRIDLKLVATALEIATRVDLPLHDARWGFDPSKWRRIFPKSVIDFMIQRAAPRTVSYMPTELIPFPAIDDLPVIVAVRMSMAFPGLFTPVPVAIPDPSRRGEYVNIHLADGGITSNLPSTLCDEPIPEHPVFVENLRYGSAPGRRSRRGVDSSGVWMPRSAGDGNLDLVETIESRCSRQTVINLTASVITAARTWTDNRWLRMPGYRERIVEVWLDPDEGGFNLRMNERSSDKLISKGERAADMLIHRYAADANGRSDGFLRHARHRRRILTRSMIRFANRWSRNSLKSAWSEATSEATCHNVLAVEDAIRRINAVNTEAKCTSRCRCCGSRGGVPRLMFNGDLEDVTDDHSR
ncbi:MAG: patatin-like phospholipase family protein [Phycisphaerales bacterium]